MKKTLIILFDLALMAYMLFVLGFSNSREHEVLCSEVKINMIDTLNSGFLTKPDIEKVLLSEESEILGYPLKEINIRKLESVLKEIPYIKSAQIYSNMEGVMNVDIVQRKPLVRIISGANNTYYLDHEGYVFRSRTGFTPHVLIANGYFSDGSEIRNIRKLEDVSGEKKYKEWFDALHLADFIQGHDFWKSQIVQIYYNRNGDFELIPRVGAHQIIFGSVDETEDKFKKLMTLYNEGLTYKGWNTYDKINLKYKNQVICTKR